MGAIPGGWDLDDMAEQFRVDRDALPAAEDVIWARYEYECYEGNALVIYMRGDTLYEVHGSHCSCYGLEDQWDPEDTTWAALAMRQYLPDELQELIRERTAAGS